MKLDPRKVKHHRGFAILLNITVVPWARIDSSPVWGKAMAPLAALLQIATWPGVLIQGVIGDVSSGIILLASIATVYDWWQGRTLAKMDGDFVREVAKWGLQSKISNIVQLFMIRGFEAWLASVGILDTKGFVTAMLATALFAEEMSSIHSTRVQRGARAMPLIGKVINWMNTLSSGMFQVSEDLKPRRRRGDRDITTQFPALRGEEDD